MKKILVLAAAAAALAIAAPASAQGPLLTPAASAYNWNGLYIGVHAGYVWANRSGCFDFASTTVNCVNDFDDTFSYGQNGWLAGAQAGYNWMFSPNWLVGVEVDLSGADIRGTLARTPVFGVNGGGVGIWNMLTTATAKIGWVNGPWLLFAEAGYGFGEFYFRGNTACNFHASQAGPLAGVGVAMKVAPGASVSLKYDHIWFDTKQSPCLSFGFIPTAIETRTSMDVVKLGLNLQIGN